MFRLVLQKMLHNGWMVLCLAAGSVLAVSLISSIPMYTDAIMQRMLVRDLEQFQVQRGRYPGNISARYNFYNPNEDLTRGRFYDYINESIEVDLIPKLGLPVLEGNRQATLDYLLGIDPERPDDDNKRANLQVQGIQRLEDHITIVHGRMSSPDPVDGVYEVIATEEALMRLDMVLGKTYSIENMMSEKPLFQIKVVGTFAVNDTQDLYWFRHLREYSDSVLIDFEVFEKRFIRDYAPNLTYVHWFAAVEYQQIKVEDLPRILQVNERYTRVTHEYRIDYNFPIISIFEDYNKRANTLNLMLLFLQTPVLLRLVFFIYMVSQLVVMNERDEIAVLKSRGAGTSQVFNVYLTESAILGAVALITGPLAGFIICSFLGSSNGFMEFVQRLALPVRLNYRTYAYALAGLALFVVTMLIPVFVFSRATIVEYKREKVRSKKSVFWKKYFIDVILVGFALYGLYRYRNQQEILLITGVEGASLPVDPLLFAISVLFILGTGLLVLRLFPYLVNMLFLVGRNFWRPSTYAAFIHVGRSGGIQQFLMIFLILSLSIGVFNSTAARTINRNVEEKIYYGNGADLTIRPFWEDLAAAGDAAMDDPFEAPTTTVSSSSHQYVEPSFELYERLEGAEMVTKVFRQPKVSIRLPGGASSQAELMGVIPHEFAEVAWFRRDLLPFHINAYLGLLASSPKAMLVSNSVREQYDIKQGDSILVTWAGQSSIEGIVYAFIDFWPGINPLQSASSRDGYGARFVVANLSLIHAKMAIEPYDTWVRKIKGTPAKVIYDDIEAKEIPIIEVRDSNQEIIKQRNDPMLQGTNGVLTLGFLVSMAISLAGFVIYWVLSLKSRTLQFGIVRAMGLEKRRLSWMLIFEHLLISGTAILLGIGVGRISSSLFVPLIQLVYASSAQVPPFRIVNIPEDMVQIYIIGGLMIVIGIVLFRIMVSRLNVHQALKLGEE